MALTNYTPSIVEDEIAKLIASKREYIARNGADSTGSKYMQHEVLVLERALRELELRGDMYMNAIAEDITGKILAVRKHPCASKFVGIMAYYELVPRHQWREGGKNIVACVSNRKGWPNSGEGDMVDMGGGQFLARCAGDAAFTLGGEFVTLRVDEQDEQH